MKAQAGEAPHTSEKKYGLSLWVQNNTGSAFECLALEQVSQVWFTHLPARIQVHMPNSQMSEHRSPVCSKVRDKLSGSV